MNVYKDVFPGSRLPLVVKAPGRVNIIGEHVDYNDGYVLPGSIDKAAWIAISFREDDEIHLFANDLKEKFVIQSKDVKPQKQQEWANYILGPYSQFVQNGFQLPGFNAVLSSDVPIGAGLSSSAAIECATVLAFQQLLEAKLNKLELIKMAQLSEHEFAGVKCGIMDQFASIMGKQKNLIKLDCRSLDYKYVPFDFEGVKILLLNTNVKHSLATSAYNTRRMECDKAIEWINEVIPNVRSLRDVSIKMLDKIVLPKDPVIYARSRFVVEEIYRLEQACKDLVNRDIYALGINMYTTHYGLSTMYEVSCKELDWLVASVAGDANVYGARMMGGGFGGCTINLVKESAVDHLIERIKPTYEREMGLSLSYYIASIEDGAQVVFNNDHRYA